MAAPGVPLYLESPPDAALDVALSHALLDDAALGCREALRVWTPPPALSFGRLDLLAADHARAATVARANGLEPVRRLAGGRAAAIGPGTACLGWASPSRSMFGIQARYETLAGILVETLGRLGIEARIGELAGEWCPGAWSILVGETKVGGLAQRAIRGGAWAEAVVVLSGSEALRTALDRVQHALGIPWRPSTLAALGDAGPGVSAAQLTDALVESLASRWEIRPAALSPELWEQAGALRAQHVL